MRRTKGWWAQLTAPERSELVYLERAATRGGGGAGGSGLPEGYYCCAGCSDPTSGTLCTYCGGRIDALIAKANDGWYPAAEMMGTIGGYYDV